MFFHFHGSKYKYEGESSHGAVQCTPMEPLKRRHPLVECVAPLQGNRCSREAPRVSTRRTCPASPQGSIRVSSRQSLSAPAPVPRRNDWRVSSIYHTANMISCYYYYYYYYTHYIYSSQRNECLCPLSIIQSSSNLGPGHVRSSKSLDIEKSKLHPIPC